MVAIAYLFIPMAVHDVRNHLGPMWSLTVRGLGTYRTNTVTAQNPLTAAAV